MSLSRKPKPFSAAVTIALRPFPSSKRRRFARKKSRISDLSLPTAVPLGAGRSWSLESSTLSLSLSLSLSLFLSLCPSLFPFPSHGSLTTRRESIRDRRRSVDSQRARRRPGIRRPVTGNRSCRPHWPANHPKSRVRHVCNADPGKPEPPAAPTTPACPALHVRAVIKIPRKRIPACPRSLSTRRTFYGTSTVARLGLISRFMAVELGSVETQVSCCSTEDTLPQFKGLPGFSRSSNAEGSFR